VGSPAWLGPTSITHVQKKSSGKADKKILGLGEGFNQTLLKEPQSYPSFQLNINAGLP